MKKFFLLILFLLALASVFYMDFNTEETELTLYGNIETHTVKASFQTSGRLLKLYFEEGDPVKKGDLLAKIDDTPYQKELAIAKAELVAQEITLEKARKGYRNSEILQGISLVEERKTLADNLKISYDRIQSLYASNAVSKQELDNAKSYYEEALARLEIAQSQLDLLEEGNRLEDIQIQEAKTQVAQELYNRIKIRLDDTVLYAPQDGIITTRAMEEGEMLAEGQAVYSISIINPVRIRAYIDENKLGFIKLGDKVNIKTDSAKEALYSGSISFISNVNEFTPKSVQTEEVRNDLVYRIRITVEESSMQNMPALHQGMPVTITLAKEI